jgi:cell division protein FtsB
MINFRYHIVSLTAVFLALAVGLAMGTTFLNKATTDQLRHQISAAEGRIDSTKATNQDLRDQLDRYDKADKAMTDGIARVVGGQLTDVPVLVMASDGSDKASLDNLRTTLGDAGADLRGTLVVADAARTDGGHDDELAAALGKPAGTDRATLQEDLQHQLAGALQSAADRKTTSTAEQPQLIRRLLDAGFLRYDAPDDAHDDTTPLAGGGYRYVFVSGPDPKVPDDELVLPVIKRLAEPGSAPLVVASAATGDDAEANRTLVVGPVRNDDTISSAVSTVDDLEHSWGLYATVLAVRDLEDGIHGHYGWGDGASGGVLPTGS